MVLTGLFDDEAETPETYRSMFLRFIDRGLKVYCANPDVIVERGDRLVYCAGALAQLYVELGGDVTIIGKPYKPVYDVALAAIDRALGRPAEKNRVLAAIGDGLPTDIKGARGQGIDVLMVTARYPWRRFRRTLMNPNPVRLAARLEAEGLTIRAAIPTARLVTIAETKRDPIGPLFSFQVRTEAGSEVGVHVILADAFTLELGPCSINSRERCSVGVSSELTSVMRKIFTFATRVVMRLSRAFKVETTLEIR